MTVNSFVISKLTTTQKFKNMKTYNYVQTNKICCSYMFALLNFFKSQLTPVSVQFGWRPAASLVFFLNYALV